MTIRELIEILDEIEDKDAPVYMEVYDFEEKEYREDMITMVYTYTVFPENNGILVNFSNHEPLNKNNVNIIYSE